MQQREIGKPIAGNMRQTLRRAGVFAQHHGDEKRRGQQKSQQILRVDTRGAGHEIGVATAPHPALGVAVAQRENKAREHVKQADRKITAGGQKMIRREIARERHEMVAHHREAAKNRIEVSCG